MEGRSASGVDRDRLRHARQDAARIRATWLTRVATGHVGVLDVVVATTRPGGKPLRAVRVKELLRSQPAWGYSRSGRVMRHLRASAKVAAHVPDRELTLSWLLDNRARDGDRFVALLDALEAQSPRLAPWPGFPYQSPPREQDGAA